MFSLRLLFAAARTGLRLQRVSLQGSSRSYATEKKDLNISHSRFLAEASPRTKWKKNETTDNDGRRDDLEGVTDTRGQWYAPQRQSAIMLICSPQESYLRHLLIYSS